MSSLTLFFSGLRLHGFSLWLSPCAGHVAGSWGMAELKTSTTGWGFQTFWLCLNNLKGMIGWDDYLYLFLCWVKATNQTKLKMRSADWCCFQWKLLYDALWLYCFCLVGVDMTCLKIVRCHLADLQGPTWIRSKTLHFFCAETFDRLCQYWKFRSSGSRSMFHSRHIHIQKNNIYI